MDKASRKSPTYKLALLQLLACPLSLLYAGREGAQLTTSILEREETTHSVSYIDGTIMCFTLRAVFAESMASQGTGRSRNTT